MIQTPRDEDRCPICKKELVLFKIIEAAAYLHVNKKTIYGWLEEGKIYAVKTPSNIYRVCKGCLTKSLDS